MNDLAKPQLARNVRRVGRLDIPGGGQVRDSVVVPRASVVTIVSLSPGLL